MKRDLPRGRDEACNDARAKSFAETFAPQQRRLLRFATAFSLTRDLKEHGIRGYQVGNHFWSEDGADHWHPHEITSWSYCADDEPPGMPIRITPTRFFFCKAEPAVSKPSEESTVLRG